MNDAILGSTGVIGGIIEENKELFGQVAEGVKKLSSKDDDEYDDEEGSNILEAVEASGDKNEKGLKDINYSLVSKDDELKEAIEDNTEETKKTTKEIKDKDLSVSVEGEGGGKSGILGMLGKFLGKKGGFLGKIGGLLNVFGGGGAGGAGAGSGGGILSKAGGLLTKGGGLTKGLLKFGGSAIGGVIGAGLEIFQGVQKNKEIEQKADQGLISKEQEQVAKRENNFETTGRAGGTFGGALAGGAAGAAIGSVVPVIGTAIGGLIGAGIGAFLGGEVGGEGAKVIEKVTRDEDTTTDGESREDNRLTSTPIKKQIDKLLEGEEKIGSLTAKENMSNGLIKGIDNFSSLTKNVNNEQITDKFDYDKLKKVFEKAIKNTKDKDNKNKERDEIKKYITNLNMPLPGNMNFEKIGEDFL